MNKTKIFAIAATAVGVVSVAAYVFSIYGSEVALMERFPDIDPQVVIKAHRKMIRATFAGAYENVDTSTDEAMDAIFLSIVNDIQK